jgi:aminoglycoside phosphotransferase (APT) family kinase protein
MSRPHTTWGALPAAPAPVCYCDREDVLGAPFYLMRRIRGVILRHDLPEGMTLSQDDVRRLHLNFVTALAELHAVDFTAVGLGDLGKPVGYVARQVTGWIERYRGSQTDEIPEFDALAAWLPAHQPAESGAALVHNDFKFDNLVLAPEDVTRVVGVLDWEMSTLGDPLMDLGTALCYWIEADDPADLRALQWGPTALPGGLSRRALAEQYAERTGRDIRSLDFYYVFGLLKTAVIAQQIYYRFQQGKTHDALFARFLEATRTMLRAAARAAETGRV